MINLLISLDVSTFNKFSNKEVYPTAICQDKRNPFESHTPKQALSSLATGPISTKRKEKVEIAKYMFNDTSQMLKISQEELVLKEKVS